MAANHAAQGRDNMSDIVVSTERLVLRHWRDEDREPFARLNADARVMEFMPGRLSRGKVIGSSSGLRLISGNMASGCVRRSCVGMVRLSGL